MFSTDAKTIQCATRSGLMLAGSDHGTPEWMGTRAQFKRMEELLAWVDEFGTYPWAIKMSF